MASDVSPWKLGGLSVKELAVRVWNQLAEDEVFDRAAALAYYLLFALFPALLFLTSLLGMLPFPALMDTFMAYVSQALPGDAASIVQKTLTEIVTGAHGGLLSFGVLAALWASSNGMSSIMTALNVAYDVEEARPFWKRKLVAVALTIGFAGFILTALILLVFGPKLGQWLANWVGLGSVFTMVWNVASIPVAMLLVAIGIALVYYLAPASTQRWRWVTPGSAVAVVVWVVMSAGLRVYVSNFANYNATYGSIGGVILLMLWLYLTGVVLLLGAEINAEIEHAAAARGAVTAKARGERAAAADRRGSVVDLRRRMPPVGVTAGLSQLVRLRIEMVIVQAKRALVSLGVAIGVAVVSLVVLVAGLTVLVAAAFAPLFDARWEPLVAVGGGAVLLAAAGLAWTMTRLRRLNIFGRTAEAVKEDWRWLETRLRSGLTWM